MRYLNSRSGELPDFFNVNSCFLIPLDTESLRQGRGGGVLPRPLTFLWLTLGKNSVTCARNAVSFFAYHTEREQNCVSWAKTAIFGEIQSAGAGEGGRGPLAAAC